MKEIEKPAHTTVSLRYNNIFQSKGYLQNLIIILNNNINIMIRYFNIIQIN